MAKTGFRQSRGCRRLPEPCRHHPRRDPSPVPTCGTPSPRGEGAGWRRAGEGSFRTASDLDGTLVPPHPALTPAVRHANQGTSDDDAPRTEVSFRVRVCCRALAKRKAPMSKAMTRRKFFGTTGQALAASGTAVWRGSTFEE